MALKFPPPPYLASTDPKTQALNRWLLEIQSILNADGTVDIGDSPILTGDPTAPTAPPDTNTSQIATTAFVLANSGGVPATAVPLVDATPGLVGTSTKFARQDHVHPTDTSRAPLASPVFTGTPQAPTPTLGDNSTDIATTAFVQAAVGGGGGGAGLAQAWVNFTAAGAITESFNVSGVSRTSAGVYVVTFASAFATAHYVAVALPISGGAGGILARILSQATGSISIDTVNTAFAATDPTIGVSLVVFGT